MFDYIYFLIDSYLIDIELCDFLFEIESIYKKCI